jgi:hypothetical protein
LGVGLPGRMCDSLSGHAARKILEVRQGQGRTEASDINPARQ